MALGHRGPTGSSLEGPILFFPTCCCELSFFNIIATDYIEPQTAIILSVLTLKQSVRFRLHIQCWILIQPGFT